MMQIEGKLRDAHVDDFQATIIKEKKGNRKIKHLSIVYEDFHKQKSNLDACTDLVGVRVLGQVMLDLLRSRYLLSPFSTTRLSIKPYSSLALDPLSLFFW